MNPIDYSIDAVARMTGISAFTLRNWEKRYEFLKPKRLGNGFRTYDDQDVELLRKVSALLRHGAKIGDLAESIQKGRVLPEIIAPVLAPEVEERAKRLYDALMEFDLKRAESLHAELVDGFEEFQVLDLIYAPLLAQMGRDWNAGETTLAQEHFASAFIRMRLSRILTASHPKAGNEEKKVICATTTGELHEGGLMLLTAHLKLKGWSTYYLGANLPIEDVHQAAIKIQPKLVCFSFTDKHGIHASLRDLSRFNCKVCIGGFGALTFDAEESLPSHLRLFKNSGRNAADVIETISE